MVLYVIPTRAYFFCTLPVLLLQSHSPEQSDLLTPLWPFSHTNTLPSCSTHGWAEAQALLRPVSEGTNSFQTECPQRTLPSSPSRPRRHSVSPVPAAPGTGMVTSEQQKLKQPQSRAQLSPPLSQEGPSTDGVLQSPASSSCSPLRRSHRTIPF